MVKNRIKVYARLKRETKHTKLRNYDIHRRSDCEVLVFYPDNSTKRAAHKFRFDKVFSTSAEQSDIFDVIARPVINGVLNGFNGTIFAYGPTGTGKTYSLTGSHTKYKNRGLIPRTIEYVFNFVTKSLDNYAIYISYLEIYNEVAYDLLNPKEKISSLEELPRVILLEDNKGEAHFKNLTVRHVCSEEEAMRLLFLGDTNRTIAETPLNEYSSRSHCVFTVHVTSRSRETGKIRRSKLNLVDLAGSERLNKMSLNGALLSEAKYINLSLHYLEQVILALSESRRAHIPFRNSIMTFMLRDSISGNCLTAMLATMSIRRINYEESLTTCKFSQRVSMVKTNAVMNEETDPQQEISFLRNEVLDLRKKLSQGCPPQREQEATLNMIERSLTKKEECECRLTVRNFLNGTEELSFEDISKVKCYVHVLRDEVIKNRTSTTTVNTEVEDKYKEIIKQKDKELSILMNIFENKIEEEKLSTPQDESVLDAKSLLNTNEKAAFHEYISIHGDKFSLNFYLQKLTEKHNLALAISNKLGDAQKKIINVRKDLDLSCDDFHALERLSFTLKSEQNVYRELLMKLQNIKNEIDYLNHGMSQAKIKIMDAFKKWLLNRHTGTSTNSDKLYKSFSLNYAETPKLCYQEGQAAFGVLDKITNTETVSAFNIHTEIDSMLGQCGDSNERYQEEYENFNHFIVNGVSFNPNTPIRSSNNLTKSDYFSNIRNQSACQIGSPSNNSMRTSIAKKSQHNHYLSIPSVNDSVHCDAINVLSVENFNIPIEERSVDDPLSSNSKSDEESCLSKEPTTLSSNSSRCASRENNIHKLLTPDDSSEFIEFMMTIPLTGENDVDEEIVKFYRMKFNK